MKNKFQILYEDNHLIAINKPAGMLSQGDDTGDQPALDYVKDYIKEKYNKPGDVFLGLVHRLDRPVSGVLLFARTSKALIRMNELFKERKVKKTYFAITTKRPDPLKGKLEHILLKDKSQNQVKVVKKESKEAKKAVLDYSLFASLKNIHLLKINPVTGRPHQIRVQLSKIGCPVLGDIKYGGEMIDEKYLIYLHCFEISFIHPVKKTELTIQAKPIFGKWYRFDDKLQTV